MNVRLVCYDYLSHFDAPAMRKYWCRKQIGLAQEYKFLDFLASAHSLLGSMALRRAHQEIAMGALVSIEEAYDHKQQARLINKELREEGKQWQEILKKQSRPLSTDLRKALTRMEQADDKAFIKLEQAYEDAELMMEAAYYLACCISKGE